MALRLSARLSVVLMKQRPYVVREKVHSAPLIQEETVPQGGMATAEVLSEKFQRGFAPTLAAMTGGDAPERLAESNGI